MTDPKDLIHSKTYSKVFSPYWGKYDGQKVEISGDSSGFYAMTKDGEALFILGDNQNYHSPTMTVTKGPKNLPNALLCELHDCPDCDAR